MLWPALALAQEATGSAGGATNDLLKGLDLGKLTSAAGFLFVLAVLLETALTLLFTSPLFLSTFNRRNLRAPISLAAGVVLVEALNFDFLGMVQQSIHGTHEPNWPVNVGLTALILAGGSAGVRNMMISLGLVTSTEAREAAQRPPLGKGWLAVRLSGTSNEQFLVTIAREGADKETIGVARLASRSKPFRWMLLDSARVPRAGGYAIEKGTKFTVEVASAMGQSDEPVATSAQITMGEGAIIDLQMTVQ